MTTSSKLEAPAAERNKEPIWKIWQQEILEDKKIHNNKPDNARQIPSLSVLEIAAGTGAHAHYFCTQLLAENKFAVQWQPVDADARYRASVQAYIDEAASSLTDDGNRRPQQLLAHVLKSPLPLTLDEKGIVEVETQRILQNGETKFDVIYCANMIHIAPYAATVGLMQVASEYLAADGVLFLYGPYKVNGDMVESNRYVFSSNITFNQSCTCFLTCVYYYYIIIAPWFII